MINVAIVGATGYAGEELIGLLLKHPQVRITDVSAKISKPEPVARIFPKFANKIDLVCKEPDIDEIIGKADLVFLALPHTVSLCYVPKLLKAGKRVIDLSADYRLHDPKVYENFYHVKHKDGKNLSDAVYGLPELYRERIRKAHLLANPGCYPTVCILSLAPLAALGQADINSAIIDAKSGVTGAGRKAAESLLFGEVNEDFKAYKVNTHQHAPEIDQELSKLSGKKVKTIFVPHLLPVSRGILATIYIKKPKTANRKPQTLLSLYKKFYKHEPFVRIRAEGDYPRLKDVAHTNFCDISIKEDKQSLIIVGAIDNLLKGASGQAVQNMNIMYGFSEKSGLV